VPFLTTGFAGTSDIQGHFAGVVTAPTPSVEAGTNKEVSKKSCAPASFLITLSSPKLTNRWRLALEDGFLDFSVVIFINFYRPFAELFVAAH
jgi:hypothetical protein